MEAYVSFQLEVNNSSPIPGGAVRGMPSRQHLKYRFALPRFDENRSGYLWALIVHRNGDGQLSHYTGGEVVAGGSLNPPSVATPAIQRRASLAAPKLPKSPDYSPDSTTPKVFERTVSLMDGSKASVLEISSSIALLPDTRKHNIEAATLSLTYWPDRDSPDAYAELVLMGKN